MVKNLPASAGDRRHCFDPQARKIPRRRARQPTPVFLPGHGQRSLVGYSSWDHKESDMTGAVPKSYSFKKLWPYPNLVF